MTKPVIAGTANQQQQQGLIGDCLAGHEGRQASNDMAWRAAA